MTWTQTTAEILDASGAATVLIDPQEIIAHVSRVATGQVQFRPGEALTASLGDHDLQSK